MAETKKDPASKKKGGGFKVILMMFIVGMFMPFGVPTLIVCLGLVPTVIALLTDTDRNHSSASAIGFMNLAGVIPFMVELWDQGQTMDVALAIVRNPTNWLIMLGSAGIGQLILYVIPPAMSMMTVARLESRLELLKDGQEQLRQIWGNEVATGVPVDLVRKQNGAS